MNEAGHSKAYVDAPELFHRVECDNLLEQIIPVVIALAAWRLCEPQGPCICEGVFDIEIVRIMKDGNDIAVVVLDIAVIAGRSYGNGVQRNWRGRHGDGSHVDGEMNE